MSAPMEVGKLGGVSSAVARRLNGLTIYTTADLLRASAAKLMLLLRSSGVTSADVQRWRSVASLLELKGMLPDWAEALSRRGVGTARDLSGRSFSELRAMLSEALTANEIGAPGSDDEIAALMVDSARLAASGVINLTVCDQRARPIRGVRVRWSYIEESTDPRGRARLLRLPLNQPLQLTLEKRGYKPTTQTLSRARPLHVLKAERVTLTKAEGRPARKPTLTLSQYDGDQLPPIVGPIRQRTEKGANLRRGDVVRWVETLRSGDAKVSTIFLEFRKGEFLVRLWRIPTGSLPAGAKMGDHFLVTRTGFRPLEGSAQQLARIRILKAMLRGARKPKTAAEFREKMERHLKEFLKRTQFSRVF